MLAPTALIPIRDENPTHSFPYVTIALIVINVLVFFTEPALGTGATCESAAYLYEWGMIPAEVTSGQPFDGTLDCQNGQRIPIQDKGIYLNVLTSMFLHGGLEHIVGNMLFLWIFGNNIEDILGRSRFILFYMLAGIAASLAHAYTDPTSTIPTIGASGAIAGTLGGYVVLFPRARVTTLIGVHLPAIVVLGLWFASQFLIGTGQQPGSGGVAWMAHVGGFVAGAISIVLFGGLAARRRRRPPMAW